MQQNDHPASASLVPASGDPLSAVLETIHLEGAFFFVWEPAWPYSTGVPSGETFSHLVSPTADQIISYHIVTQGPCWGSVAGQPPVRLESGDILLLPHGDAYAIGNDPRPPQAEDEAPALEFFRMLAAGELPTVIVDGGEGPQSNRLICGFLACSAQPFNPLLGSLPSLIHLPAPAIAADPLSALIQCALAESQQPTAGARCMLKRLSETMFVEVIRRYMRTVADETSGWLGGLRDPVVGRALHCLHQDISYPWTLEQLARQIGSSRTILAQRFNELVGVPPIQYLTQWRMQVAASRLNQQNNKTFAIAQEVGYESEASFSRAFKRIVGLTPSQWRQRH